MKKWVNSARHALRGCYLLLQSERNARIELCFALLAFALGLWLQLPLVEWGIILLCIGGVLMAEALNSSIERLADLHTLEPNRDIRDAKDLAAGAVLIISLAALVCGAIIFIPRLLDYVRHL